MTKKKPAVRKKTVPVQYPKPLVEGPSVIVCREKNGNRYFVVNNDKELYATALIILRGRFISDWYFSPLERPADLDYVKKDVEKMPPSFRNDAYEKLRKYEESLADWKSAETLSERIHIACSNADGNLAWTILRERISHEYEDVFLEKGSVEYEYTIKDPVDD